MPGNISWQPDDGGAQGYLMELYSDSLVTLPGPGMALRVITPASLEAAMPSSIPRHLPIPSLSSGSALIDAAWALSASRMAVADATPYIIAWATPAAPSGWGADIAGMLLNDRESAPGWPLADTRRLMRIIALGRHALVNGPFPELGEAIDYASTALRADSARLYRTDCGLWAGGGDGVMSGPLPYWMDGADRFNTVSLAVNILAAEAYSALAVMEHMAGMDAGMALGNSRRLAEAINDRLWMPARGYYSQYLYGRLHLVQGPAASGWGNALAAASARVTPPEMTRRIVGGLPRTPYGLTLSYPLGPGAGAPEADVRVQGIWASGCARAGNARALWSALSVLLRLTGIAAATPDEADPDIWGAFIATVSSVLFGLDPVAGGLHIAPVVPPELTGDKRLSGIAYRDAVIDLTVSGTGSRVATVLLDGLELPDHTVPATLTGHHSVRVEMIADQYDDIIPPPVTAPELLLPTPRPAWSPSSAAAADSVARAPGATYAVYLNGLRCDDTPSPLRLPSCGGYAERLVIPLDADGVAAGFAARPHSTTTQGSAVTLQAEWFKARELARDIYRRMLRHWSRLRAANRAGDDSRPNRRLTQIVELTSADSLVFTAEAPAPMRCVLTVGYADGRDAGGSATALRSVYVNGHRAASVAMPRTGLPADTTVTLLTHPVAVTLDGGLNRIKLASGPGDLREPPGGADTVMIDFLRIIPLDR